MPFYYVTMNRVEVYNFSVEADDENKARTVAWDYPYADQQEPSESYDEITYLEEVKKHVE